MPLQQRTASFAVLPGAYLQQLADDQGHSMWPPYANLMARRQVNLPETLSMRVCVIHCVLVGLSQHHGASITAKLQQLAVYILWVRA